MSASLHSPIGRASLSLDATETAAREAADRERREREHDAWAIAITQVVVEARPKLTLPLAPEPAAAPASAGGESVKVPTLGHADAGAAGAGTEGAASRTERTPPGPPLPSRLIAELSDSRLGRMELSIARGANGLHIVINVADAHVKALIEAERSVLLKSLQGCGLRVDSVEIGSQLTAGTALAQQESAEERALARSRGNLSLRSGNARWRGYGAPAEEEPEEDTDRVDLTA
jgi:hypothetical protein